MGVNLWGESPLYVNPANVSVFSILTKVLAEGKGVSVRKGLKEARTLATQTGMPNQWLKDQCPKQQCFFVDRSDFFGFTMFHGYIPFLNPDYQPTYCNWYRNEYSLFHLGSRLTAI